jgi:hypothetical protein
MPQTMTPQVMSNFLLGPREAGADRRGDLVEGEPAVRVEDRGEAHLEVAHVLRRRDLGELEGDPLDRLGVLHHRGGDGERLEILHERAVLQELLVVLHHERAELVAVDRVGHALLLDEVDDGVEPERPVEMAVQVGSGASGSPGRGSFSMFFHEFMVVRAGIAHLAFPFGCLCFI